MAIVISASRAADIAGEENNPFVAWENLGSGATLGGTAVLTGGERANAVTGTTYDKWRPDVSGTSAELTFDFGADTSINFAALAGHNAQTFGATVAVEYSADAVSWYDNGAGSVTPSDNNCIGWRFRAATARYWRFKFTGLTAGDDLSAAVAFLGSETIMPRRFYQGFSPVITPTEVELQSNVSVGAHLLGSVVVTSGSTLSAEVRNLDAGFIRGADWLAFQRAFNTGEGFFFGWRPEKYPEDFYYCARAGGVIRPENSGPRDLMSVRIDARVYCHE